MTSVFSRNARTKLPDFHNLKEAVDFAVPYPHLTQCGIIYRLHTDGRKYIDWSEFREAMKRLGFTGRGIEFTTEDMETCDLGPIAQSVEELLAGRLR